MSRAVPILLAVGALLLAGCGSGKHAKPDASGCIPVQKPDTAGRTRPRPTTKLELTRKYDVTIDTNCGEFTIRLDPSQSPNATASFASLVESNFYDGTLLHRIQPGFVIQAGDPTATGTGGPGYTTVDKPPADARYTHGVVAMAKTGVQPPGTAGSQFFVVTAADASLTADYAIVGTVVQGLDVVDRIGKLGDSSGHPTEQVEIQRATLRGFK